MNLKHFFIILILISSCACQQQKITLKKVEAKRFEINSDLILVDSIESFIKPYRDRIQKDLDNVLAYAPEMYSKSDGELNTSIGNLMADLIIEQSNPIFNKRTKKNIDVVLLNHGGIRSAISKGKVTTRTAYELMPFENEIVIIGLKGINIKKAIKFLINEKRAHPIAGLNIVIDKNRNLLKATIKSQEIDDNETYYVATSDYLYNGGDRMSFFKNNEGAFVLDYKIRNAIIDYFKKVDTVRATIDNRFVRK